MDPIIIVAIIAAIASIVAALVTYLATRSKTQTDAKVQLDQRIDARVARQLEDAWTLSDEQKEKLDRMGADLDKLKRHSKRSDRRERLMYEHTTALRNHILNELPPPPPLMPPELEDWYEQFDLTDPQGHA